MAKASTKKTASKKPTKKAAKKKTAKVLLGNGGKKS